MYWCARELVGIEDVYLDAEFYSADVLQSLNASGAEYVMSDPKGDRLKRFEKRMRHDVAVKQDHGVFGPIEGFGKGYARTNIVVTPSIQNPDKTVLFATNKEVKDEIGLESETGCRDGGRVQPLGRAR